jgi:hypothetical protein
MCKEIFKMCKLGKIVFGRVESRCRFDCSSFRPKKVFGQLFVLEICTKFQVKYSDKDMLICP